MPNRTAFYDFTGPAVKAVERLTRGLRDGNFTQHFEVLSSHGRQIKVRYDSDADAAQAALLAPKLT